MKGSRPSEKTMADRIGYLFKAKAIKKPLAVKILTASLMFQGDITGKDDIIR